MNILQNNQDYNYLTGTGVTEASTHTTLPFIVQIDIAVGISSIRISHYVQ